MKTLLRSFLALSFLVISPSALLADADGPDFFRVTGLAANDVIDIRSGPTALADKIGKIPHDASGIRNLGCEGGMSYAEWETATTAQRDAAMTRRWCRVSFDGVQGWVAARFLAEDSRGDTAPDKPSFDCSRSDGEAEGAICSDPVLAVLDRELARLYDLAVKGSSMSSDRLAKLRASQRGWIKGRNDCWKSDTGLKTCVTNNYAQRIHELREGYANARSADGQGMTIGPLSLACEGFDAGISAVFVNSDEPLVSLKWRDQAIVLPRVRSASGAKYQSDVWPGGTATFWQKGENVRFTPPGGETLTCKLEQI